LQEEHAVIRFLSIFAFLLILVARATAPVAGEVQPQMTLYKNPQCGCCEGHADYLRQNGFDVKVLATHDLPLIKREHDVPDELAGCHTILTDGYVIEGHISAEIIKRLLNERPAITGISLPGMPMGSPGMLGDKTEPFTIYTFGGEKEPYIYAVE
jgi:hypothetical protein